MIKTREEEQVDVLGLSWNGASRYDIENDPNVQPTVRLLMLIQLGNQLELLVRRLGFFHFSSPNHRQTKALRSLCSLDLEIMFIL